MERILRPRCNASRYGRQQEYCWQAAEDASTNEDRLSIVQLSHVVGEDRLKNKVDSTAEETQASSKVMYRLEFVHLKIGNHRQTKTRPVAYPGGNAMEAQVGANFELEVGEFGYL